MYKLGTKLSFLLLLLSQFSEPRLFCEIGNTGHHFEFEYSMTEEKEMDKRISLTWC
jgi:hypothetical protein